MIDVMSHLFLVVNPYFASPGDITSLVKIMVAQSLIYILQTNKKISLFYIQPYFSKEKEDSIEQILIKLKPHVICVDVSLDNYHLGFFIFICRVLYLNRNFCK